MKNKIKNLIFDSNKGKIKLNERASIFFFCLLLATCFWFLSSLSKNYTTKLTIPIEYTSFNRNFILVETPSEFIEIQVSGSGFELLGEQMSLNRNALQINLENALKLGRNRFGIATSALKNEVYEYLDKDIRFERITSDTIVFKTDQRITKRLKIVPNLDLSFESSYNLIGEVVVSPNEIEVSGPKGILDSLNIISTNRIIQSELSDSISFEYDFSKDERFNLINTRPSKINILVPVGKFTEKSFEIPVTWDEDVSIRTFPNRVKVVFLVPLSNYEQLSKSEIEAKVKLTDNFMDQKKLKVAIKGYPHFAKLVRIEPEKIEFIIKQ